MSLVLKLNLKSKLQRWPDKPYLWTSEERTTAPHPTARALVGMIGCAMGIHREEAEKLQQLKETLSFYLAKSKPGQNINPVLIDLQNIGTDTDQHPTAGSGNTNSRFPQTRRHYLQDAEFTVYVAGDQELLQEIEDYLIHPIYQYYFGTAVCIPSSYVSCGFVEKEVSECICL